jgi:GntR family transcriptional regulator
MGMDDRFLSILQKMHLELHPESPVPLYYQLSRYLEKLIQDEAFPPGERFPTEEAIAGYFQVSRPTANKAVQVLLAEGSLSRDKQDKRSGTFVREKPFIDLKFLAEGLSFADQFPAGVPLKSQLIWIRSVPATVRVANALAIEEGAPTIHMRRLRYAYNRPILICDSQLSEERFPELSREELIQDSLYKTLEIRYNCPIVSSERYAIAVEAIEQEVVRLLGAHPFSSILMITGVSFTHGDDPIDYMRTYLQQGVTLKSTIHSPMHVQKAILTTHPKGDSDGH